MASNRTIGYKENYFSLGDILATQEKVPSTFESTAYNLGYLDPSNTSDHLQTGSKMELPFWLAKTLCTRRRHFVSVDMPKAYKEGYREILSADPTVVDLHKLGPYFYIFGSQLLRFDHPESADIARSLVQSFQGRFRKIMDCSQNAYNESISKLTEKLDESERTVFGCGQQGLNDFQKWETRKVEKITSSDMVAHHRKRKLAQMEAGQ